MSEIIRVRVLPRARKNEVREEGRDLKVHLTAPPDKGKANKTLIKVLAEYFGCRKSDLRIVQGGKSRDKLVQRVV